MSKFDTKEDLLVTMQLLMDRLTLGTLTMENMEELVATSREFYERTLILRYKSYEQEVFGAGLSTDTISKEYQAPTPKVEVSSSPSVEVESQQEKAAPFNLSFSLFDQLEQEEALLQEIEAENEVLIASSEIHQGHESHSIVESTPTEIFVTETSTLTTDEYTQETTFTEEIVEEIIQSEIVVEEEILSQPTDAVPANFSTPSHQKDAFDKMIERDNSLGSQIMGTRLDTLNGAFGLNEKLQLINELFDGSSELFYQSVQIFDSLPDFEQAKVVLKNYSTEFSWEFENPLVIEFVQKIARRYV
jgi:hypothetical protein